LRQWSLHVLCFPTLRQHRLWPLLHPPSNGILNDILTEQCKDTENQSNIESFRWDTIISKTKQPESTATCNISNLVWLVS
jgi:hypothetical protein